MFSLYCFFFFSQKNNKNIQVYSCEYGNFLCNSEKEIVELAIRERTPSLWSHVEERIEMYLNPLYQATEPQVTDVLLPSTHQARITLWTAYVVAANCHPLSSTNWGKTLSYHLRYVSGFAAKERCGGEVRVWDAVLLSKDSLCKRI